ncbi:hypothetical protein F5I97DRAFT_1861597 [Phlebopus sp. FC_14]|nr:hypothetical protein F5I97DRAFT_1861597 [Phlebopus sp. FC_14]
MPTSELSDALNPHYVQSRSRSSHLSNAVYRHPPIHNELELASAEPARPPPTPPLNSNGVRPSNPNNGVTAVQELMRFLASTRESQEIERKRRLAWEQEQEAKYRLRQAEMERRMIEMRQEISVLKARFAFSTPAPTNGAAASNAAPDPDPVPHSSPSEYAISHVEQQPTPTTSPSLSHSSTCSPNPLPAVAPTGQATSPREASTSSAYLPSPSLPPARFISVDPSSSRQGAANPRKRSIAESNSEGEKSSDSDAVPSRLRRRNHHDTRCLTIQHAMRNHLLRVMQLESDKDLPDSHVEGTSLGPDDPVRFVWGKTPKQSVHNGRMKDRVLKDLKVNRHLYKYVPDKDFGKKTLDSAFDQAFVTLRQKFKAQRDTSAAVSHKQREDTKAMRARRLSRRKTKLSNRSHARNKIRAFEHVTFDGALQMECMSSEESEFEEDHDNGSRSMFLRTRGLPWRSLRLQRLFDILDKEDRQDNAQKPRRGVGRKERYVGPPKEGLLLPPKGVASWMVSKRWLNVMRTSHVEVVGMLEDIVTDPVGFDWTQFHALGEESEDDGWLEMGRRMTDMSQGAPHYGLGQDETITTSPTTSSSLVNALSRVA